MKNIKFDTRYQIRIEDKILYEFKRIAKEKGVSGSVLLRAIMEDFIIKEIVNVSHHRKRNKAKNNRH